MIFRCWSRARSGAPRSTPTLIATPAARRGRPTEPWRSSPRRCRHPASDRLAWATVIQRNCDRLQNQFYTRQ